MNNTDEITSATSTPSRRKFRAKPRALSSSPAPIRLPTMMEQALPRPVKKMRHIRSMDPATLYDARDSVLMWP